MAQDWRNRSRYSDSDDDRTWGSRGTWEGENWAGGTEYPDEQRTFGRGETRGRPGMPRFGSFDEDRGDEWRRPDWPDYERTWRGDRDYGYGYGSRGERERRDFRQGRGMWSNQRGRNDFWGGYVGARPSRGASEWGRSWRDDERRYEPNRDDRGFWDKASDEVSSWFGDHEAERRRRMDEDRGEHRGRGPRGYVRSDERIREDVSDALTDHPYLDASEIEISVANGEVTLSGTVDDRWAKRRAEDCAEDVSGVRHVQNNLRVKQTAGTGTSTGSVSSGQTSSAATSTGMSVKGPGQKV